MHHIFIEDADNKESYQSIITVMVRNRIFL